MNTLFAWLEASSLSTWLRESPSMWGFPFVLILHTVGLAFVVGANVTVAVRVLGLVPEIPLAPLRRYAWVMWTGFWVNAASGVALLLAYPTKALTNPLFYVKLLLVAAGMACAMAVWRGLDDPASDGTGPAAVRLRRMAGFGLAAWIAAIPAGRLLAYTCTRLMVDAQC
jgi:hypothetical protein